MGLGIPKNQDILLKSDHLATLTTTYHAATLLSIQTQQVQSSNTTYIHSSSDGVRFGLKQALIKMPLVSESLDGVTSG